MSIKATPTTAELPPIPWFDPLPQPVVIEMDGDSAWAAWDASQAELDEKEQQ